MPRMRACAHCREAFEVAATGRPPKYCSASCRRKAWETGRLQAARDQGAEAERERWIRPNETELRPNETRQDPLPADEEWTGPIGLPFLRLPPPGK